MTVVLCLPNVAPITLSNFNYSGIVLGLLLIVAVGSWFAGANVWFKADFDPQAFESPVKTVVESPPLDVYSSLMPITDGLLPVDDSGDKLPTFSSSHII